MLGKCWVMKEFKGASAEEIIKSKKLDRSVTKARFAFIENTRWLKWGKIRLWSIIPGGVPQNL